MRQAGRSLPEYRQSRAGVDMLEGDDGPLVMEVNSSPGLQGIEQATKLDVAGAIIDYIANQVAFSEHSFHRCQLFCFSLDGAAEGHIRSA